MRRTTKGALSGGAAVILLLGGAGTIAFWTDTAEVPGTTIGSGHLDLTPDACTADWLLDGGATFTNQLLVPGDTLTKSCDYTLDLAGAHLTTVDFTVTAPSDVTGAQALVDEIGVTAAVELNGVAQASATDVVVADGDEISVDLTITWPHGVKDNDSNVAAGLTASLAALTVVVEQNHG